MVYAVRISNNECIAMVPFWVASAARVCTYGRPFVSKLAMTTLCKKWVTSRNKLLSSRDNIDTSRKELHASRDNIDTSREELHTSGNDFHTSRENCIASREAVQDNIAR